MRGGYNPFTGSTSRGGHNPSSHGSSGHSHTSSIPSYLQQHNWHNSSVPGYNSPTPWYDGGSSVPSGSGSFHSFGDINIDNDSEGPNDVGDEPHWPTWSSGDSGFGSLPPH